MAAQGGFVQLLDLGVQAVIHKLARVCAGLVLHVEMHELGAQRHQLVHLLQQVVGQLVAEPQRIRLVLVQRDGALAVPQPRALLQFNFVVFLGVAAGGLPPDLHRGVGHRLAVAHRAGQRTVLVPHL